MMTSSKIECALHFELTLQFEEKSKGRPRGERSAAIERSTTVSARKYVCSSKTKQRIFKVATDLFLSQGYEATTLSDIAKAADISTSTLYRHYPLKGDFLVEIGKQSVERLKEFAAALDDSRGLYDSILAIMLEDIEGTRPIFFGADGQDADRPANDIRLAYSYEIYASKEHLDIELATRSELASIYASVIERGKERGEIDLEFDSYTCAQIIVAIFFSEFDKGIYRNDYPYELRFREKLDVLFEGRLRSIEEA